MVALSKSGPDTALYYDAWVQALYRLAKTKAAPFSFGNLPMLITGTLSLSVLVRTHQAFKKKFIEKIQGLKTQESSTKKLDIYLNIIAALFKSVDKSAFSLPVIINSLEMKSIISTGIVGGLINCVAEYATLSDSPLFLGNENIYLKSALTLVISFIASALNALLYAESINGFAVHMGWAQDSLLQKLVKGETLGAVLAITNLILALSLFMTTLRTNINLIGNNFFKIGSIHKLQWFGQRYEEICSSIYKGSTSTSSMFALLNTIFVAASLRPSISLAISGCIGFVTVTFNVLAQHALLSSRESKKSNSKTPLLTTSPFQNGSPNERNCSLAPV